MKNYLTPIVCLLTIFVFLACKQTTNTDSQQIENQEITIENKATHETSAAPQTLTDEGDVPTNEAAIVEQIRADYGATMEKLNKGDLKKITKDFSCEEDPAEGTLTRYYEGEQVVILEHSIGHEHGWISQKIYFKNGQPYFVFAEVGSWYFGGPEKTDDSGENTIDDISETRYYIHEGNVIRKLNKKYLIKSWEAKPKIDKIPNKTVTEGVGKPYPEAAAIPMFLKGDVGC